MLSPPPKKITLGGLLLHAEGNEWVRERERERENEREKDGGKKWRKKKRIHFGTEKTNAKSIRERKKGRKKWKWEEAEEQIGLHLSPPLLPPPQIFFSARKYHEYYLLLRRSFFPFLSFRWRKCLRREAPDPSFIIDANIQYYTTCTTTLFVLVEEDV